MSAIAQPDLQSETNHSDQPEASTENVVCVLCGNPMMSAGHVCPTTGTPRRQAEEKPGVRIATPAPKLMSVQKPYDPYAQFYATIPDAPKVIPPEPEFGAASFGGLALVASPAPAEKESHPALSANLRTFAAVILIVLFAFAAVFGLAITWNSRGTIAASLNGVRARLHEMDSSRPNPWPAYTVTPVARAKMARRTVAATSSASPESDLGLKAAQSTHAPRPSGPGTVRIRISPAPPAPNVIPVTIQDADAVPAPAGPDGSDSR